MQLKRLTADLVGVDLDNLRRIDDVSPMVLLPTPCHGSAALP